jgi:hypothetical protein
MLPTTLKPIEKIRDLRGKFIRDVQVDEGKLFLYFSDGSHVFFTATQDALSCFIHDRIDLQPGSGSPERVMFAPKKIFTMYDPLDPRNLLEES